MALHSGSEMDDDTGEPSLSSLPTLPDTTLCREPAGDTDFLINNGPDQYTALLRTLQRSADHFADKDQTRIVERLQFEMVRLHMQNEQWQRAMRTLVPLWQSLSWRQAGWWNLLDEVDWALKECARRVRDAETLAAVEWELMSRSLTKRRESCMDFGQALDGLGKIEPRPKPILKGGSLLSCLSASFAFANTEGNVGEPLEMQVVLKSSAHLTSRPIQLSQIRIEFTAGLKNIIISNSAAPSQGRVNQAPQSSKQDIELRTSTGSTTQSSDPPGPNSSDLYGDADLVLFSGCTTALSASCIPRDAGEVFVGGITLDIKEEGFDFEISFDEDDQLQQDHFWVSTVSGVSPKSLKRGRSYAVNILPKPPKMQIGLLGILGSYFIDELVVLDISIANEEDETAEGILDVRLSGPAGPPPKLAWAGDQSQGNSLIDESSAAFIEDGSLRIPPSSLGSVAAGGELQRQLRISHVQQPTEYNLRIESRYSLKSDPETLITKIYTTDIVFIQPFEVSCAFTPQVHPDPWPNYFDPEDLDDNEASQTQSNKSVKASGLLQRWALFSRLHNLTPSDDLILDSITPIVHYIQDAVVHDVDLPLSDALSASTKVHPNSTHDRTHVLDVQKLTLDDRRPTTLDLDLRVIFHRPGSTATSAKAIQYGTDTITTQLPLPPLHLNYSEPRVLASLSFDRIAGQAETPLAIPKAPRPIHLTYTLENPSTYTLPFTVTMETPDTSSTSLPRQAKSPPQRRLSIGGSASAAPGALFAFSGPKAQSFHMLPLSRRELHYTILPFPSASSSTAPGSNSGGEQQAAPGMEGDRDTVVYPILRVIDRAFGKRLRVWPTAMLASNAVESSKAGGTEGGEVVLRADNRRGVGQAPGSGETAASGGSGIAIWISN